MRKISASVKINIISLIATIIATMLLIIMGLGFLLLFAKYPFVLGGIVLIVMCMIPLFYEIRDKVRDKYYEYRS